MPQDDPSQRGKFSMQPFLLKARDSAAVISVRRHGRLVPSPQAPSLPSPHGVPNSSLLLLHRWSRCLAMMLKECYVG